MKPTRRIVLALLIMVLGVCYLTVSCMRPDALTAAGVLYIGVVLTIAVIEQHQRR